VGPVCIRRGDPGGEKTKWESARCISDANTWTPAEFKERKTRTPAAQGWSHACSAWGGSLPNCQTSKYWVYCQLATDTYEWPLSPTSIESPTVFPARRGAGRLGDSTTRRKWGAADIFGNMYADFVAIPEKWTFFIFHLADRRETAPNPTTPPPHRMPSAWM